METKPLDVEKAVSERYSAGARVVEKTLCCPVDYDPKLLAAIPEEILERDYGCGNPTPFVRPGDTVLDLGSGAGKACYLAAQLAGRHGRVIGIDMNDEMLQLARQHRSGFAERIGYDNVEFRKARIQDLRVDLDLLEERLREYPVRSLDDLAELEEIRSKLAADHPLVADSSVDCIVSNCVLNLVRKEDRIRLFQEIYRVLRNGGRAAISDIVSDEPIPASLQRDPALWSGCISGAFQEREFLRAFADAGFHGMEIVARGAKPYAVVEGIEFRSITVTARKGKPGPCSENRGDTCC